MKNMKFILPAALLALSACNMHKSQTTNVTPANQTELKYEEKGLYAKMKIKSNIKTGEQVTLQFTAYNAADTAAQFCKWHTPFEPLMSKYLDIKAENGEEVAYKGAMAKRIMPPPATSYIKINPKDSLASTVDLLKAYDLKTPGRYTITYVGQNMSGLAVKDSVSFTYGN